MPRCNTDDLTATEQSATSGCPKQMEAEFDTAAEWTARVAADLGPEYYIAAACRGSGQPAVLDWLLERLGPRPGQLMIDVGAGLGGPAARASSPPRSSCSVFTGPTAEGPGVPAERWLACQCGRSGLITQTNGGSAWVRSRPADGTEIFYKDWGSGQPIVFSHGWPLSADDWDTQLLFFLQHGYRVIAA